jgi:hypothetical protein
VPPKSIVTACEPALDGGVPSPPAISHGCHGTAGCADCAVRPTGDFTTARFSHAIKRIGTSKHRTCAYARLCQSGETSERNSHEHSKSLRIIDI